MDSKTAAFITLGCKINQYETEAIRREVLELGYEEVKASDPANVYVVNTCSVTAQSGIKSRKYIQHKSLFIKVGFVNRASKSDDDRVS